MCHDTRPEDTAPLHALAILGFVAAQVAEIETSVDIEDARG
jgi:hypothetical protein